MNEKTGLTGPCDTCISEDVDDKRKHKKQYIFMKYLMLFCSISLILANRSWNSLFFPELAYEDGRDMLAFFYNTSDILSVFRFYGGYVTLGPNILSYLFTRLPIICTPYLMTVFSILVSAYALFIPSTTRYRWLIPSDRVRYIVCLILALMPLGKNFMIFNLTYSEFSFLLILILLLGSPLPKSVASVIWEFLIVCFAIVSHPLSIVGLPLCILRMYFNRNMRTYVICIFYILIVISYQIFAVESQEAVFLFSKIFSFHTLKLSYDVFLSRVVIESIGGTQAVVSIISENYGLLYLCLLGIVFIGFIFLFASYKKDWCKNLFVISVFLGLSWGLVFAACALRQVNYFNPYMQRYIYVPKILFMLLFLSQVMPYLYSIIKKQVLLRQAAIIILFLIYLMAVNIPNKFLYRYSLMMGKELKSYLSSVHQNAKKAKDGGVYENELVLKRNDPWDIIIRIDERLKR